MSLTLQTVEGSVKSLTESEANLRKDGIYKWATVHSGTWIFYKNTDFNAQGGGREGVKFLDSKSGKEIEIDYFNGSVRLLNKNNEGIVLFQHFYYGGEAQYYNGNYNDVSHAFSKKGASSAIVLGGEFIVYANKDFKDPHANLSANKYPTPTDMRMSNDSVQSIKKPVQ